MRLFQKIACLLFIIIQLGHILKYYLFIYIFFSDRRIVFFPSNCSVFIKVPVFFFWFHVSFPCFYASDKRDGSWKLAASLQTLQSLCSPTELLSAPIPCFFLPTRRQRACEEREWGLQWKQHLFSDSCLLKRQLAKKKESEVSFWKFQTLTWKRV